MIQHYKGNQDSKRVYVYHRVPYVLYEQLKVNASKPVQVKTPETRLFLKNAMRGVGFEPTNLYRIGASVLRL